MGWTSSVSRAATACAVTQHIILPGLHRSKAKHHPLCLAESGPLRTDHHRVQQSFVRLDRVTSFRIRRVCS